MRSLDVPLKEILGELRESPLSKDLLESDLRALCEVEIGLYLQEKIIPNDPAITGWAIFSGYPFAEAWGTVTTPEHRLLLRIARHSVWSFRSREAWNSALQTYQTHERLLRGYDVASPAAAPAVRRSLPAAARDRWDVYEALLLAPPPFEGAPLPIAAPGYYEFWLGRSKTGVAMPVLPSQPPIPSHDLDVRPGPCGPLTFGWDEFERTADYMDSVSYRRWRGRLDEIRLFTAGAQGFARSERFTVSGMLHLLGIVGVGKSTLRDVLTVHLARTGRRVTVVVGDVAEQLRLVEDYNLYAPESAVPVIGVSSREQHAQRLHRRLASRTSLNLLAHDGPGFASVCTSCSINALRWEQQGVAEPLPYTDAPCTRMLRGWTRHFCSLWASCPRHLDEQRLVSAPVWVTTPQSLVSSSVPDPQNAEQIRYLELACRRSDLIIIDEADRVQMQLDRIFAPAVTLEGGSSGESFLLDVNQRKLSTLAEGRQEQLSSHDVETWSAAVNTVTAAVNRIYPMLLRDPSLRKWVRGRYFNSWTLQLRMVEERYPLPEDPALPDPYKKPRERLRKLLDEFKDNPFGDKAQPKGEAAGLVHTLADLLLTGRPAKTRKRLTKRVIRIFDLAPELARVQAEYEAFEVQQELRIRTKAKQPPSAKEWLDVRVKRFEFTLLLCLLETKLALMNAMWPRVSPILKLDFNEMYRSPRDYAPMIPESPMGNVLGFQFLVDGHDTGGVRSGELQYFRCSGLGRELLRAMPGLAEVDGLPGTNVILMSGSSWASVSSRYNVHVPVGALLRPECSKIEAISRDSRFRMEFLQGVGGPLTVSGTNETQRPEVLRQMITMLGAADHDGLSRLSRELNRLPELRRHLLILVGSYEEATLVADALHAMPNWKGDVIRLAADDEDLDTGVDADEHHARVLRRGDLDTLALIPGRVLVAPLLAVERGHNILNEELEAAIGTTYFLARPNPRPDDLGLAVHAINDWMVRALESGEFATWVQNGQSLDQGASAAHAEARSHWYRLLARSLAWSRLGDDRATVTWDMLVLTWQVIGRLVRGGVPANAVFVDAAFAPFTASGNRHLETSASSLLHSIWEVLDPAFRGPEITAGPGRLEQQIIRALFYPLWAPLDRCLNDPTGERTVACLTQ
ncbi:pPIWI_RE_Z domain-containing protein [Streptosporangium saharense]|uniref:pPIWI-RE three-gene island domain-containing protein n=1 Tax=Streptosporangium saharense TaxID=1706840 RepID=A0A7W7VJY2_9ACTN|nr:hypothetical protein [Streptosporangium saharense]MBB4913081.1 hypothetical protein [Streptosporangium saharense]